MIKLVHGHIQNPKYMDLPPASPYHWDLSSSRPELELSYNPGWHHLGLQSKSYIYVFEYTREDFARLLLHYKSYVIVMCITLERKKTKRNLKCSQFTDGLELESSTVLYITVFIPPRPCPEYMREYMYRPWINNIHVGYRHGRVKWTINFIAKYTKVLFVGNNE